MGTQMSDIDIASLLRRQRKLVKFSELLGKTITYLHKTEDVLLFICDDDTKYIQFHIQECCESVILEDVCGDLSDLIGTPILYAEEVGGQTGETGDYESHTWTFYKLSTIKGSVTLRWYGTSNGYYSESVDFAQIITEGTTNV